MIHPHFFIAVPISEASKVFIHHWLKTKKNELLFNTWVHQQDYHITLAFLGHVEEKEQLRLLSERVKEIAASIPSFDLTLKGLDVFGRQDSPRIFWAGIENSSPLHYLQKQVFHACNDVGFILDSKPFHPHITLARKWRSEKPYVQTTKLQHVFESENHTFLIENIHIYRTHTDRIPKYESIDVFLLKDR